MTRIGTLNIQDIPDIPRKDVIQCARITKDYTDIAMFQEIREAEDVEDVEKGLGKNWKLVNTSSANPIGFDTRKYRLTPERELSPGVHNRGILQLHQGNPKVPTRAREATWCILSAVERPNLRPFVVTNAHFINNAWNNQEKRPLIKAIRKELWLEGLDEWQWSINNFRRRGLTVIWGGDLNCLHIPRINAKQLSVARHRVDHIYAARGRGNKAIGLRPYWGKQKAIETPSDHKLLVGYVNLIVP